MHELDFQALLSIKLDGSSMISIELDGSSIVSIELDGNRMVSIELDESSNNGSISRSGRCCRTISLSSEPRLLLSNKNFNLTEVTCSENAIELQLSAKNGSIRTFCSSKAVNNTTDLSFILLQNENLTVCMKTPFNNDGQGFLVSFSYECGNLSFAILDRSLDQHEKIFSRFNCETFFNVTARIFTVRLNRIVIWVYSRLTNGPSQNLQFVISAITLQGLFCQVTLCDSNPCKNGQCSLTPRGFVCICNSGFWGVFCEKDEQF
ncbi:hypothetical protein CHS0354_013484 [Potamilus streckersoni]|uniref:EGF-like domain-containing protein n=1 Tax=Potamilus streckersoni TaxID=2493646 RepID=A0AAE0W9R9_9BIVA|nr:hypothetical protein CHS0354_013484 [Potamilus streckersoni]